jgi:hypothetical protein
LVHDSNKRFDEKITKIDENFEHLDFRPAEIKSSVEALEQQNLKLKSELVYLKSQKMKNNLIFGGIDEDKDEKQTDTEVKVREFLKNKLILAQDLVASMKTELAHRTGAQQQNERTPRPRNIVYQFTNFKDRETVRKQGYHLRGTAYIISEQFPPAIMVKRRNLMPKLKAAKKDGTGPG